MGTKTIALIRVSTEGQAEEGRGGIAGQLADIERIAATHDLEIVEEVQIQVSGAKVLENAPYLAFLDRLDSGSSDSDDPQDDFCRAKAFEKFQGVVPVGIFYRNRVDRGVLDRVGQCEVGLLISLGIVLLVKLGRIAATDVDCPIDWR